MVHPKEASSDPTGRQVRALLADFGIQSVRQVHTARLFLLELPDGSNDRSLIQRIGEELLADRVTEEWHAWPAGVKLPVPSGGLAVEVHFKPGVMDNVALSTQLALTDLGIDAASVRTARRYELFPIPCDADLARLPRLLGNACIEDVVIGSRPLAPPPKPPAYEFALRTIPLRNVGDSELTRISATGHLFLSLEEMQAIQAHYRRLVRDPTDLELETLAQTWSEHCVHKTLKSAVVYHGLPMPPSEGPLIERRYDNLLRDTIVRATEELIREGRGPRCLSVFKDNAGVIAFDDEYGVAFKVETHNHPSAIEPYGGASTGVGGVIRDVLGCGQGAQPIANTDVFCVAPPDWPIDGVPKGVIHPKTLLKGVVAGVRDYGNRMGIPTVNGAVHFDPRFLGNPLVYCGCVGLIPRDRVEKSVRPGDLIVVLGGPTGRDGIHGATFSSAELTDAHEDEFAHAVQIGNAIEEKKLLDVILQARDFTSGGQRICLYSAITDCGAGGLSSAVGEMAAETGAEVDLEKAPLKYSGLRYDEIWISESQERMVLAVSPEQVDKLLALAASEDVAATVIGRFTDTGRLVVRYQGRVVGDLDMTFLHEGLPKTTRVAEWSLTPHVPPSAIRHPQSFNGKHSADLIDKLKCRLSDPTIASKHWLIRQYDHEVGGRSVVKPLVGRCDGPGDAAVIRPRLDSNRGIVIGCGLAPHLADVDPYWMAVAAIDEALRNVVCVGGDPARTAILDNFCWPRVDDERNLGALVRACQACYDAAKAYGLPFISGKDSLNNEFAMNETDAAMVRRIIEKKGTANGSGVGTTGRLAIPYTLLISAISLIDDVGKCITSAPKRAGDAVQLFYVGVDVADWGRVALSTLAAMHAEIGRLIDAGEVAAAHDSSEGGPIVAVTEMAMSADAGCRYHIAEEGVLADPFVEVPSAYILQPPTAKSLDRLRTMPGILVAPVAEMIFDTPNAKFEFVDSSAQVAFGFAPIRTLREKWRRPLDW